MSDTPCNNGNPTVAEPQILRRTTNETLNGGQVNVPDDPIKGPLTTADECQEAVNRFDDEVEISALPKACSSDDLPDDADAQVDDLTSNFLRQQIPEELQKRPQWVCWRYE